MEWGYFPIRMQDTSGPAEVFWPPSEEWSSREKPREVAYAFIAGTGKQREAFSHFQADLEAALSLLNLDPKRWEHQAKESNKPEDQWR